MKFQINRYFLIFLTSFLIPVVLMSQTLKVEAPSSVDINDYFKVQYVTSTTNVGSFVPPDFSDFELLAGPSYSSFSQSINGRVSESSTITFVLRPRGAGSFTIGPASAVVNGQSVKTKPVTIRVTGTAKDKSSDRSSNSSRQPDNYTVQKAGTRVSNQDVFIQVSTSRNHVYEQEAVLITYRIYAKLGVGLSNVSMVKKPDFKDIVSQEIPISSIQTTTEQLNGQTYRTGKILQYLVFPQKSGKIRIPGITFNVTIAQQMEMESMMDAFFNGGGYVGVNVQRSVDDTYLDVKPLPLPKPTSFTGAVGSFNVQREVLPEVVQSNDVATYRLTVSGKGNLRLIPAMSVSFPSDMEHFDPKTSEEVDVVDDNLSGSVAYDYSFVPRNAGKQIIPEAVFTYFNPELNKYVDVKIPAVVLDVKKGKRTREDVEREMELRNSDIRDLHDIRGNSLLPSLSLWGGLLLQGLLLVCSIVLFILLRRFVAGRMDAVSMKRKHSTRKLLKTIKKVRKDFSVSRNSTIAFAALSDALRIYLSERFNIPLSDFNSEHVQSLLQERVQQPEVVTTLMQILSDADCAKYAPALAPSLNENYFDRVVSVVDEVEKNVAQ